jgi:cytochrome c556
VKLCKFTVWLLFGILAIAPSPALARTVVPGPWGDIVDHQKPLVVETDRERMTLLRRNQMRAISGHFRSIEAVVTYRAPFTDTLAGDAAALVAAARVLPALFPPGSGMDAGKFGAKPEIWQHPEKFAQHGASFTRSIERLSAAVAAKADLEKPLTAVRNECLACHQAFRVFAQPNRPAQPASK